MTYIISSISRFFYLSAFWFLGLVLLLYVCWEIFFQQHVLKAFVEAYTPVEIDYDSLEKQWHWLTPKLKLEGFRAKSNDNRFNIYIPQLNIHLDLLQSFLYQTISFKVFDADRAHIRIDTALNSLGKKSQAIQLPQLIAWKPLLYSSVIKSDHLKLSLIRGGQVYHTFYGDLNAYDFNGMKKLKINLEDPERDARFYCQYKIEEENILLQEALLSCQLSNLHLKGLEYYLSGIQGEVALHYAKKGRLSLSLKADIFGNYLSENKLNSMAWQMQGEYSKIKYFYGDSIFQFKAKDKMYVIDDIEVYSNLSDVLFSIPEFGLSEVSHLSSMLTSSKVFQRYLNDIQMIGKVQNFHLLFQNSTSFMDATISGKFDVLDLKSMAFKGFPGVNVQSLHVFFQDDFFKLSPKGHFTYDAKYFENKIAGELDLSDLWLYRKGAFLQLHGALNLKHTETPSYLNIWLTSIFQQYLSTAIFFSSDHQPWDEVLKYKPSIFRSSEHAIFDGLSGKGGYDISFGANFSFNPFTQKKLKSIYITSDFIDMQSEDILGWRNLSDLTGSAIFELYEENQNRIEITMPKFYVDELSIENFSLHFQGNKYQLFFNQQGSLERVFNYLKTSPIRKSIEATSLLHFQGEVYSSVDLKFLLNSKQKDFMLESLDIDATLADLSVFMQKPFEVSIAGGRGFFEVRYPFGWQAYVSGLHSEMPLLALVQSDFSHSTELTLSGSFEASQILGQFNNPLLDAMVEGYSDFILNLDINSTQNGNAQITGDVASTLQGVELLFPEPFNKSTESLQPSELAFTLIPESRLLLEAFYNESFQLSLVKDFVSKSSQIGVFFQNLFFQKDMSWSDFEVNLMGSLESVDLKLWGQLLNSYSGVESLSEDSFSLKGLLSLNEIFFDDLKFDKVFFEVDKKSSEIKVQVDFNELQGKGTFDQHKRYLDLDLDYLKLMSAYTKYFSGKSFGGSEKKIFLSDWLYQVSIDRLYWDDRLMGALHFTAQKEGEDLIIAPLYVASDYLNVLPMQGSDPFMIRWDFKNKKVMLDGEMHTTNLERLLEDFNLFSGISAGRLDIDLEEFLVSYPVDLNNIWPALEGDISLNLKKGSLERSEVGSSALFKILGLLDVQILSARPFENYFQNFSNNFFFKKLEAHLRLNNGNFFALSPIKVESLGANFYLSGKIDMQNQLIDNEMLFQLSLLEEVSNYGWAYLLFLNPWNGIYYWFIRDVLNAPIRPFFSVKYLINGSFGSPQVHFQKISDRLKLSYPHQESGELMYEFLNLKNR